MRGADLGRPLRFRSSTSADQLAMSERLRFYDVVLLGERSAFQTLSVLPYRSPVRPIFYPPAAAGKKQEPAPKATPEVLFSLIRKG